MPVFTLREIMIGVKDLPARKQQFIDSCGLSVLKEGWIGATTATRFLDSRISTRAAILGRSEETASPRIRLVEVADGPPARAEGIQSPGPLGITFATPDPGAARARMSGLGWSFLSSSLSIVSAAPSEVDPSRPLSPAAYGRADDGDFIILTEENATKPGSGEPGNACSPPLGIAFVVTNMAVSTHFVSDVLEHEISPPETFVGAPDQALVRRVSANLAGSSTSRMVLLEFQARPEPMTPTPGLSRGICRLRYDTTDIHATLSRVPGGGGSFVRGPEGVSDPLLGRGLVAMVRSPFGVLMEFWQPR